MAKKKLAVRHRNKSGRFSKRGKRERVYSQSETILRRVKRAEKEREKKKPPPPEFPPDAPVFEFIISFSYEDSGRSFDVIATARDEQEAYFVATRFLQEDREGQRIVRSGFHRWTFDIPKGVATNVEAGNAEYRNKSRARRKKK
jgi:hypothetical protein